MVPLTSLEPWTRKLAAPVEPAPMASDSLYSVTAAPTVPPLKLKVSWLTVRPPLGVSVPPDSVKFRFVEELAASDSDPPDSVSAAEVSVNEWMDCAPELITMGLETAML